MDEKNHWKFCLFIIASKSIRVLQRVVHIHHSALVIHQPPRLRNASRAGILQQKLSCPVYELTV
jgi:hypothetical protein